MAANCVNKKFQVWIGEISQLIQKMKIKILRVRVLIQKLLKTILIVLVENII